MQFVGLSRLAVKRVSGFDLHLFLYFDYISFYTYSVCKIDPGKCYFHPHKSAVVDRILPQNAHFVM